VTAAGTGPASEPERSADGRWIVVGGRRWRASDPAIPERWRVELVAELMDARRAVGAAVRAGDERAEAAARARVQQAKVALGERGEPWWDEPSADGERRRLEAILRALVAHRAPDRTICPSDVARARGGDAWRGRLDLVRDIARDLARAGTVTLSQQGRPLDPDLPWKGPIRIGTPAST
jgi:hypothetical protein